MGDDFGRSVGVEEAVPDGLTNGLLGAAVGAPGPRRVVDQGSGALVGKGIAELEVALLAVAEGTGSGDGAKAGSSTGVAAAS